MKPARSARTPRTEARQVKQREALADETAAKSRAAQAEADVKTAQASGLQQQAAGHRSEAVTARDELNQEFERADKMDPDTQTSDTARENSQTRENGKPRDTGKQSPPAMPRSG